VRIEVIVLNNKSLPTVDEIVNTLKRSFIPTIVIEGSDDVFIYRWLKSKLNNSVVSLQACGGRGKLYLVHDRKIEFSNKNIIFIADMDSYRFDGIPNERDDIIFTHGYCIENDIYDGSDIGGILDDVDLNDFAQLKKIIARWFAFELEEYKKRKELETTASLSVASHINEVSPLGCSDLCPDFIQKIAFKEPCPSFLDLVEGEYELNVRGKQLFQMLARFMSKKGRFSKFNEKNLLEIAMKQGCNENIQRLIDEINEKLVA
jgi:hypothetical protein